MRDVYKTILKLREREKKERQMEFAEAEAERRRQEVALKHQKERLFEEQEKQHRMAGMIALSDLLNMQRSIDIQQSETDLTKQEKKTESCRQGMMEAQIQFKVMEEVIASIEKAEQEELERKNLIFQDELGLQLWRRGENEAERERERLKAKERKKKEG